PGLRGLSLFRPKQVISFPFESRVIQVLFGGQIRKDTGENPPEMPECQVHHQIKKLILSKPFEAVYALAPFTGMQPLALDHTDP
ncbi:hypothetical protein ABG768_005249, partial [Culter alburnus]